MCDIHKCTQEREWQQFQGILSCQGTPILLQLEGLVQTEYGVTKFQKLEIYMGPGRLMFLRKRSAERC